MKCIGYLKAEEYIDRVIINQKTNKIKYWLKSNSELKEMGLDAAAVFSCKYKQIENMDEYWQKNLLAKCSLSETDFEQAIEPKTSLKESLKSMALPAYLFELTFTLARPYFSRDDELFYFMQNPVAKEPIFKVPMVRASTWKGKMRWVGMKQLTDLITALADPQESVKMLWEWRGQLVRLFGNETETEKEYLDSYFVNLKDGVKDREPKNPDEDDEYTMMRKEIAQNDARQGYLNFYATYFYKVKRPKQSGRAQQQLHSPYNIGYEVTNKLNDQTRTGEGIVKYEVVPRNATGVFTLLYAPYNWVHQTNLNKKINADLERIRLILKDLFFVYGFSAKGENWGTIQETYKLGIFNKKIVKNYGFTLDQPNFGGEIPCSID